MFFPVYRINLEKQSSTNLGASETLHISIAVILNLSFINATAAVPSTSVLPQVWILLFAVIFRLLLPAGDNKLGSKVSCFLIYFYWGNDLEEEEISSDMIISIMQF